MKKVLVAYYSRTGTTQKVAGKIREALGGDLFEIKEASAYPPEYNDVLKQAKQEIAGGIRPALRGELPAVTGYDLVIVGSPNWWSTIAPPVATFLTQSNFSGLTIAPFITHGGGGLGSTVSEIRQLCPGATVLDGFDANRLSQLSAWVKSLSGE